MAYLESDSCIDVLAFQEEGIKKNDGIKQFIQANAIQFGDRSMLPGVVAASIRRRGWKPEWRNELVLEREPGQFTDAKRVEPSQTGARCLVGRFFHVDVRNRHRSKIATNCYFSGFADSLGLDMVLPDGVVTHQLCS